MKRTMLWMIFSFITAYSGIASENILTEGNKLGQWTMDLDAVTKAKNQKPILLNFTGSDWCHWCKVMDKDVFTKEAWWTYAKKNVNTVWIDFPSDKSKVPQKFVSRNELLAKKYGIEGFPTYVLLSADGKKVLGKLGAGRNKTPKSFTNELDTLLSAKPAEEILTEGNKLGHWTMDFDAVKKEANGKAILLNFTGSDWCHWCKVMDKDVFTKEAWWIYAKKNVNTVWIDFPRDKTKVPKKFVKRNEDLARKHNIEGFPTYILLSADGKKVLGILGAGRNKTPKSFAKEVDALLKK